MNRITTVTSALCLLMLVAGCAGYQTVKQPWHDTPECSEFDSTTGLHIGDRIRVITEDLRTTEGTLTAIHPDALVVSRRDGRPPVEIIRIESVKSLEVYRDGSDRLGPMLAASVFVYVVAKAITPDPVFTPDSDAR